MFTVLMVSHFCDLVFPKDISKLDERLRWKMINLTSYSLTTFYRFSLLGPLRIIKNAWLWFRSLWSWWLGRFLPCIECWFRVHKCWVVVGHKVHDLVLSTETSGVRSESTHLNYNLKSIERQWTKILRKKWRRNAAHLNLNSVCKSLQHQ